ncbi:3004_t:CDS:10 [Entrophospora sp. SA101]|nr:3004_t:CDS:10 [Entrophospora sp. SA101]
MLSPQKKKFFAFFGSPPKSSATTFTTTTVISTSPMSSPNISSSILASYFPETTNFSSENNNNNISSILGSNIGDDNKKRTLSSSSAPVDDIKKSIENLERLISSFNDYHDLINKLGKTSKDINKSLKCYAGGCKGMDINHVTSIQATAQFYESNAEVQLKLKEERIYNEFILDLDNQVKKIESHEKYISSMTSIGSDIARARTEYSENVKKREKNAHSFITQVIHRYTEAIFNSFNDSIKKCGQNLTKNSSSSSSSLTSSQNKQTSNDFLEFLDNDEQQQQASLTISTILSTSPPNSLLISSPNSPPISSPSSSRAPIDIPTKRRVSTYKPSHQVTASIASMVELQKAAMDYISPKSNNHNYNNKNNGDIGGNSKYKTIEINDDEDKIEVENAGVKKNTKKENKKEENTIETNSYYHRMSLTSNDSSSSTATINSNLLLTRVSIVNQPDKNGEDSSNMEEVNAKNQNQDNVKDGGNSSNVENSNNVESSLRPMPRSYNDNDNDNNVSKSNTTPISNKCGSSVAHMKEKLLSSMNNSSSGGYVNQVKSKFDDSISNNSNSNSNEGNSSGGDDDTIKFLKKNCNCHNCQQISAVINSSMKED